MLVPTVAPADASPRLRTSDEQRVEQRLFDNHNQARTNPGAYGYGSLTTRSTLRWASDVADIARAWSDEMARTGDFKHNPNWPTEVCCWTTTGENIIWSTNYPWYGTREQLADTFMQSWMDSSGHRDNIMHELYTEVGIGATLTSDKRVYVTAVFRRPNSSAPASSTTYVPPSSDPENDSEKDPNTDPEKQEEPSDPKPPSSGSGEPAPEPQFSDVPADHAFATEITWMVGEGITTGFPDGTFRPAQPVTRQAAAAFLWRLAGEPDVTSTAGFTDVPVEHPFHDEIAWMVQEGLTTGFPDDTFRPAQPVTRQAAAAFLYRYDGEPPVTGVAGFADVPTDHPFNDEIAWMVAEGITTGFPDDTFRPANDVTRQAMAAFLYRYETDAGGAGTGDLYIEKRVAGESAPSSWSFDFTVICDDVPAGFPGDRLETDFSFASDEVEGFYVAWEGFTVGTECTITETDSGEADSVQITVDGESVAGTAVAVVIEEGSFLDGTHTRVVFTNIFE